MHRLLTALTLVAGLLCAASAHAQTRDPGHVEVAIGGDNLDGLTATAAARWISDSGHWIGLQVGGAWLRERFVAGYAVAEGATLSASLRSSWLLSAFRSARFRLGADVGTRIVLASDATPAGDQSVAVTVDVAPSVEVDLAENLTLLATVHTGFGLAVDPEVEVDTLENPLELGLRWWVSPQVALRALVFAGSAFGYGGDGAKHRLGGTLGVEVAFDEPAAATGPETRPSVGAFVGLEWRMFTLAGHVSHGPSFSAGVSFFDGWLKVGLAGFGRPGPLNPETFDVVAADGATYKGSPNLELRSDGSVVGLLAALSVPVAEWLRLELPVIVGQGGFGFYLTDDDRNTPDGRRVSAWENELLDGRDASIGLAIDVGLRATFTPASLPWLRPLVGVHYTLLPGYDAYVTDNYDGVSVVVGTELGVF